MVGWARLWEVRPDCGRWGQAVGSGVRLWWMRLGCGDEARLWGGWGQAVVGEARLWEVGSGCGGWGQAVGGGARLWG